MTTEDTTEQLSWKSVLQLNDTTEQMQDGQDHGIQENPQLPGSCSKSLLSRTGDEEGEECQGTRNELVHR